jgi:chromosome segregation ATPase
MLPSSSRGTELAISSVMEPTDLEGRIAVLEKESRDFQTLVLSHFSRLEHQVRIGDDDTRRLMMMLHDQATAKIAVLAERLERVDERLERVDERLARVDERLAQVDERLVRVEGRMDGIEQALTGLSTQVGDLTREIRAKRPPPARKR